VRVYGPGEAIVRKGDPSYELFVIERGSVAVEVPRDNGGAAEVAQLGAGQSFGEMGLLTGEPRAATVRAKTLCRLVVVDHEAFHDVLASHPEAVERLGVLLATRQAELEAAANRTGRAPAVEERSRRLISQIREFFKLV
jgi:CRP-like cAMP-binding protein